MVSEEGVGVLLLLFLSPPCAFGADTQIGNKPLDETATIKE